MLRYKLLFPMLIVAFHVCSQSQLLVSGDLRARSEYRHGFGTLMKEHQNNAFFVDQRARLMLQYKSDKYAMKLSLQDVRVWGNQSQLVRDDGALTSMHEAWGEVFLTKEFSFRIGRQEIALDDHRIFGNVDWVMQARSHDAALFRYNKNGFEAQTGFAYNQDKIQSTSTFYSVANNYKALQYLWLHKDFSRLSGSLLFLNNGVQGGTPDKYHTYFSQTIGSRLSYKMDRVKSNFAYYHQLGKEADGQRSINAFTIGWDANVQLNTMFSITPGVEWISGNNQNSVSTVNRAFNPFYGTNHKFNGLMDYFFVGNYINSVGLHDYYTHFNYQLKKFSSSLQVHYFHADGSVTNPEDASVMRKGLGTELDLVLHYQFSDEISFDAGYSQLLPTETLQILKDSKRDTMQNWAWFMVCLKPVFYKTPQPQP